MGMSPNRQARNLKKSDADYMAMALDLARLGSGRTSPNPAVGCVIVKNGNVIGAGFHKKAGLPHAEVEAIHQAVGSSLAATRSGARQAGVLRDAVLYVTLEPCCPPKKNGRTPPCTDAILKSGIREIVVGMRDPDKKVAGKGIRLLKKNGIRVRESVLKKECEALNEAYIKHRKTGLPFVILKAAITLDGMVGLKTGKRIWISSPESREMAHAMRDRVDGILVGAGTVLKDNPRLTTRLKGVKGKSPIRIILKGKRPLPSKSHIFKKSSVPTWVMPQNKKPLRPLLKKLGEKGIVTLLVEGGSAVYSSFLREGLVDQISLFIAPWFLGEKGIPMFSGIRKKEAPLLKKATSQRVGPDLLVEGRLR
jgi:diaminohydroxyphosphoribosylaminopyrimidine deaminase/5-amino-6-(5-phosphoribosylamino)uracil reductase